MAPQEQTDPLYVKSCTGFAICIANCPVMASSKLQSDICHFTMEAEYTALGITMKSVLPLLDDLIVIGKGVGMSVQQLTTFKTAIWVDNKKTSFDFNWAESLVD